MTDDVENLLVEHLRAIRNDVGSSILFFSRSTRSTSPRIARPPARLMQFAALTGILRTVAKFKFCGRSPMLLAIFSASSLKTAMAMMLPV